MKSSNSQLTKQLRLRAAGHRVWRATAHTYQACHILQRRGSAPLLHPHAQDDSAIATGGSVVAGARHAHVQQAHSCSKPVDLHQLCSD
jgi:hypothetical protein